MRSDAPLQEFITRVLRAKRASGRRTGSAEDDGKRRRRCERAHGDSTVALSGALNLAWFWTPGSGETSRIHDRCCTTAHCARILRKIVTNNCTRVAPSLVFLIVFLTVGLACEFSSSCVELVLDGVWRTPRHQPSENGPLVTDHLLNHYQVTFFK